MSGVSSYLSDEEVPVDQRHYAKICVFEHMVHQPHHFSYHLKKRKYNIHLLRTYDNLAKFHVFLQAPACDLPLCN